MRDCLSVSPFLYINLINNSLLFGLITSVIFINTNLRKKKVCGGVSSFSVKTKTPVNTRVLRD